MPRGWEGNRRSDVALAMRHRLQWFIHLRAHSLDRDMSTPPTLSCGVWHIYHTYCAEGWLVSRVVSVLDSGAEAHGFKPQSRRCRVTVLGKLFTPIVPLFTKQQNW